MASTHLAVLGSPIEHSKSPAIHTAAYSLLGLDWDYGRYRIEANELASFLRLRDSSWRGLSLTMPLKEVAFELSASSCPVASETGIVNTLLQTENGWEGYNTDSYGIQQAILNAGVGHPDQLSVLGNGATARSAIHALNQLYPGMPISVFARRAADIASIKVNPLEDFYSQVEISGLVISTLPGSVQHPSVQVSAESFILDVAYSPWPSKLASAWVSSNRISGVEMLLWQALAQIKLFVNGDGRVGLPNEDQVFQAMRNAVQP